MEAQREKERLKAFLLSKERALLRVALRERALAQGREELREVQHGHHHHDPGHQRHPRFRNRKVEGELVRPTFGPRSRPEQPLGELEEPRPGAQSADVDTGMCRQRLLFIFFSIWKSLHGVRAQATDSPCSARRLLRGG